MKPLDLRPTEWRDVHQDDLAIALDWGHRGDQNVREPELQLPSRDRCCIVLKFSKGRLKAIQRGPQFDEEWWEGTRARVDSLVLQSTPRIARCISFARHRVGGYWRSEGGDVQILPPPPGAPLPDVEMADHPFVLEVAIRRSSNAGITNHRRMREHLRISRLLNVLINGGIRAPWGPMARHTWAFDPEAFDPMWVQEGYPLKEFVAYGDALTSPRSVPHLTSALAIDYYSDENIGAVDTLWIPDDLDASLQAYKRLNVEQAAAFDLALYWYAQAAAQFDISWSLSLACLATTVEVLATKEPAHKCPECKEPHHTGLGKAFRVFLASYGTNPNHASSNSYYKDRSQVLHEGRTLWSQDVPRARPVPQDRIDSAALGSLSRLVRRSLYTWLRERRE